MFHFFCHGLQAMVLSSFPPSGATTPATCPPMPGAKWNSSFRRRPSLSPRLPPSVPRRQRLPWPPGSPPTSSSHTSWKRSSRSSRSSKSWRSKCCGEGEAARAGAAESAWRSKRCRERRATRAEAAEAGEVCAVVLFFFVNLNVRLSSYIIQEPLMIM